MRSESAISSHFQPQQEQVLLDGKKRSAKRSISPFHKLLYSICLRNSPMPTSLMARASLRLRFIPSTCRSSRTITWGRSGALAWGAAVNQLFDLFLGFRYGQKRGKMGLEADAF